MAIARPRLLEDDGGFAPRTTRTTPVAIAPPPAVVAPPPPVAAPVAPFAPEKFNLPALLQAIKPAAPVAPAPVAPPPVVAAPVAPPVAAPVAAPPATMPTIQDYLAQKQAAFKPQQIGGSILAPQMSAYDSAADIAEYKRLYGDKANPWDIAYVEQKGKYNPAAIFSGGDAYTPYTVQELQDQFLAQQAKLTPEAFAKLKESRRPAPTYDAYLADYNRKFEALPENLKQRSALQGELQNQAATYGFGWDTKDVSAQQHTYNIAKLLEKSDVKSVGELEWRTVNGKDKLFNKTTGKPVDMYKDDDKNYKQLGWTSQGEGLVNYMVEKDANGNPVIIPKWKSNAPGGIAGTLLKVAPIALSFVNPALGAAASGISSVIQGGDIGDALKAAGTSYLGGQVGGMAGDAVKAATQSMSPGIGGALTGAATGGASAAVTGALRGDLDLKNIATGALTGGAVGGIGDLINTYAPAKGTLYEQNIAPGGTPEPVSGSTFVDNVLRNAAVRAPGTLLSGGDLGDLLTASAIGEATKTATGYIPKTGEDFVDRLISGTASAYIGNELRDLIGGGPSAPSPAPAPVAAAAPSPAPTPAPAPEAVAEAPAQDNSRDMMAMLMGLGLLTADQPQQQVAAAPTVATAPITPFSFSLNEYLNRNQRQSLADYLSPRTA